MIPQPLFNLKAIQNSLSKSKIYGIEFLPCIVRDAWALYDTVSVLAFYMRTVCESAAVDPVQDGTDSSKHS